MRGFNRSSKTLSLKEIARKMKLLHSKTNELKQYRSIYIFTFTFTSFEDGPKRKTEDPLMHL